MARLNACKKDIQVPVIHSITYNPYTTESNTISPGTEVKLKVCASGPDQEPISNTWSADGSELTTDIDANTASWKATAHES